MCGKLNIHSIANQNQGLLLKSSLRPIYLNRHLDTNIGKRVGGGGDDNAQAPSHAPEWGTSRPPRYLLAHPRPGPVTSYHEGST